MKIGRLSVVAAVMSCHAPASAAEISTRTSCFIIKSVIAQNDIIAGQETHVAAVNWLLKHDQLHVLRNENQLEAWAREAIGKCLLTSTPTLETALISTYKFWAGQTRDYQDQERKFYENQRLRAEQHHKNVMRDLGQ